METSGGQDDMAVLIGTSGWSYDHWGGVLYPPGTPGKRLGYYVREFRTVELNSSFYHWPRETTFAGWKAKLPPGFVFSVKAPRGLTHARKLYEPEVWIERLKAGWEALGDRRGVLLVQLAPAHQRDDARLEYFLERVTPYLDVTVEFRHPSWVDYAVFAILERHGAAYCVMSGANLPCVLRATAPFVYVRWHGPDQSSLYGGSYTDDDLHWWADRIGEWRADGRTVYGYFNNDGAGNAVRNARFLRDLLGE